MEKTQNPVDIVKSVTGTEKVRQSAQEEASIFCGECVIKCYHEILWELWNNYKVMNPEIEIIHLWRHDS